MSYKIEKRPTRLPTRQECFFYHTMDVPGQGLMRGQWDLRAGLDAYLGHVDPAGARVLEMGPASGFLTFHLEQRGADVTACELPSFDAWDLVPYATWGDSERLEYVEDRMELGRKLRNSFWMAHAAFESEARLVTCSIYDVPSQLGPFDVATFGMILLHVRDPFNALKSALKQTTGTAVITEMLPGWEIPADDLRALTGGGAPASRAAARLSSVMEAERPAAPPRMYFCPSARHEAPKETWWQFNPALIQEFLDVLGFQTERVGYHYQLHDSKYQWAEPSEPGEPKYHPCFTVVATRRRAARGS